MTSTDLWGVLVEGPTVQTQAGEHLATRWAEQLQSFWGGPRPIIVQRDSPADGWRLATNNTLSAAKREQIEQLLDAFNAYRQQVDQSSAEEAKQTPRR